MENKEDKLVVFGGNKLNGRVRVQTSKNAILPILASTIMCDGIVEIADCPKFSDVETMLEILSILGAKIERIGNSVKIECSYSGYRVPKEQSKKMRSSIFLLGSLLSKFRKAEVTYPGGCEIGARPIDIHLAGLNSQKVKINEKNGMIYCDGREMKSGNIVLRFPSVGATENLIMSSVFLPGKTTLVNTAKEPEIEDLVNFLNLCGAKISGVENGIIEIVGVEKLSGISYNVMSDRIIAGTIMLATAITGGRVELENCNLKHNLMLSNVLNKSGCKVCEENDIILVDATGNVKKDLGFIQTGVYPMFPTDLQAPALVFSCVCDGTTVFLESIFENRFKHTSELVKMGADVMVQDRLAVVNGVPKLFGADVEASDLRGGAALVLAGLVAEGYTTISNVFHIDRGYEKIEDIFNSLGAHIERKKD